MQFIPVLFKGQLYIFVIPFECLKALDSNQHLVPWEKRHTTGDRHSFWLFPSRHFSKLWCKEIEHRLKHRLKKEVFKAFGGKLLKRRDLQKKSPEYFPKQNLLQFFGWLPLAHAQKKTSVGLAPPPPPWGPRWMKTDFRDLSRMGRYWNLDIARWRNLGEHSGLPIEIPVEQVMPSK